MKPEDKADALERICKDRRCTVILLSLRCGSVGLVNPSNRDTVPSADLLNSAQNLTVCGGAHEQLSQETLNPVPRSHAAG